MKDLMIRIFRLLNLCRVAVFSPSKFETKVKAYQEKGSPPTMYNDVFKIRRAFWLSFILAFIFGGIGYTTGLVYGCVNLKTISIIQIIGVLVLIWGILFIRGWEIETMDGDTAVQKVNIWLYKSLCCIGNFLILFSYGLSPCPK